MRLGQRIKLKTHCIHGHQRTPENVNSVGSCIACQNIRTQERRLDEAVHIGPKCGRCKLLSEYITVYNERIVGAQSELLALNEMLRQKLAESAAHDAEHERLSKAQMRRRAA